MDWKNLTLADQERAREAALRALRIYFAEQRWSRLAMAFILIITGAAGVAASWGMLKAGVLQMWLRYPLAVLIAWGAFLVLLWLWIQVERRYFKADEQMAELLKGRDPKEAMRRLKDNDSSVLDWFNNVPDIGDAEGCAALAIIAVVLSLVVFTLGAVFNVLMGAPVLFAEVFVDAVLVGALYKRVKPLRDQWWVIGAAAHTWKPVMLTAALLVACALIFGYFAPKAHTAGEVLAHLRGKPEPTPLLEQP
jgi:hypothetical protein